MNISKNLLSLGLIAVISGVSTAQTYTATAGTNGVTDIQSDYSMSTGDGASVSVDVPLEFELPKKVAIAVRTGGVLPTNGLFDNVTSNYMSVPNSNVLNTTPYTAEAYNNMTQMYIAQTGGIYSNTAINVNVAITDFIHEADSSSSMKGAYRFVVNKGTENSTYYLAEYEDNDSSTTTFPFNGNIDEAQLADSNNSLGFALWSHIYVDTIDPTDRSGKYTSSATITVSTL